MLNKHVPMEQLKQIHRELSGAENLRKEQKEELPQEVLNELPEGLAEEHRSEYLKVSIGSYRKAVKFQQGVEQLLQSIYGNNVSSFDTNIIRGILQEKLQLIAVQEEQRILASLREQQMQRSFAEVQAAGTPKQ